jgi:hypothetical protein
MPVREYDTDGLAGLVVRRRSRDTGHLYGIYRADQAGLDTSGGPWVTICEDHNTICNHPTLDEARYQAPSGDWCDACRREWKAPTSTYFGPKDPDIVVGPFFF